MTESEERAEAVRKTAATAINRHDDRAQAYALLTVAAELRCLRELIADMSRVAR